MQGGEDGCALVGAPRHGPEGREKFAAAQLVRCGEIGRRGWPGGPFGRIHEHLEAPLHGVDAHDVAVAKGEHPLSAADAATLAEVRARFFSGPEADAVKSWEGREVDEYWIKVGKIERTNAERARARFPDAIAPAETQHSHVLAKAT